VHKDGTFWRALCIVLAAGLVAYWLFADTVRRYWPDTPGSSASIRFSYWGGFDDHRMWGEVIAAFEVANPGLHVNPEWLPLSGYTTKLDQQFVAGNAPDVIMFQDEPFARYAGAQFAPLGGLLDADAESRRRLADCWPTAVTSFEHDGSLRGLPIMGGNVLVYCNLNAFDRAERATGRPISRPAPGWTMDEFVALCRLLTIDEDSDGTPEQFGLLQPHWVYYLPFIWAHGASLLDDNRTTWVFDDAAALASLKMYGDLRHGWRVTPMPIEYAGQNSDTSFLSGRVAMCVNGPWFEPFLRETALTDRYVVAPIPRGPGGSATRATWDGLCVYAKLPPDRQARAWRFVRFVLAQGAQEIFATHQRAIPARRVCAAAYVRYGGGEGSPAAAFVEAMETARLQPITPAWHGMNRAMWRHLTSVLLEGDARSTPEEALKALAADRDIRAAFATRSEGQE